MCDWRCLGGCPSTKTGLLGVFLLCALADVVLQTIKNARKTHIQRAKERHTDTAVFANAEKHTHTHTYTSSLTALGDGAGVGALRGVTRRVYYEEALRNYTHKYTHGEWQTKRGMFVGTNVRYIEWKIMTAEPNSSRVCDACVFGLASV